MLTISRRGRFIKKVRKKQTTACGKKPSVRALNRLLPWIETTDTSIRVQTFEWSRLFNVPGLTVLLAPSQRWKNRNQRSPFNVTILRE